MLESGEEAGNIEKGEIWRSLRGECRYGHGCGLELQK